MTELIVPAAVRHAHEGAAAYVGAPVRRREEREAELVLSLAPGATRPVGAGVRARAEEADVWRLCFERDLDRIKHSRPWRRLAGKCQVFIAPEDDHLRTRLTHAVEVAQVATGIARAANLCLPLVEAIALAHDCGHGPAGHASEDAFSPFLPGATTPATTTPSTAPTSRSRRSTCASRRSTVCATTRGGDRRRPRPRARWWPGPTASRTCATTSTTRCAPGSSSPTTCRRRCATVAGARSSEQIGVFLGAVLDAIDQSGAVGMTDPAATALAEFRAFNFERIYLRPAARRQAARVIRLLGGLVEHFADAPRRIPAVRDGELAAPAAGSAEAAAWRCST